VTLRRVARAQSRDRFFSLSGPAAYFFRLPAARFFVAVFGLFAFAIRDSFPHGKRGVGEVHVSV
jgi:hypothetical protein